MANNYSTVQANLVSEKFFAIKIQSARNVTSLVSLDAGTTYSYTSDFIVCNKLTVDGVAYTKTTSSSPSSSQFYFNFSTKELIVNLGAALTTQTIVAFHDLFFTDGHDRIYYENPKAITGEEVLWKSRVSSSPTVRYSQSNIINGFLTIKSDRVTIENSDKSLNIYFTSNDSFYKKEVKIFHCLDSFLNVKHLFTGFVSSVNKDRNSITFNIDDVLSKLNDTFWSGTSFSDSFLNKTDYSTMDESAINLPIRKQFGRVSKTKQRFINLSSPNHALVPHPSAQGTFYAKPIRYIYEGFEGYCTDGGSGGTNNRTWVLPFKPTNTTNYSATITAVTAIGGDIYDIEGPDITKVLPSDNGALTDDTQPEEYHFNVLDVYSTGKIRIRVSPSVSSGGLTSYTPLVNDTFYRYEAAQVSVYDVSKIDNYGNQYQYYLVQNRHFTLSTDGNGQRVITLVDNFESTYFGAAGVNGGPAANTAIGEGSRLFFARWENDTYNHADVLEDILTDAGFSVDATTFSTASSTDIQLNFTVPYINNSEFTTYAKYVEDILASSGGILKYDYENEKFYYYLISSASGSETIDDDSILIGTLSHNIEYQDIVSELIFKNEHGSTIGIYIASAINYNEEYLYSEVNNLSTYLHEVTKQKTLNVILDGQTYSNGVDNIKDFYFSPKKISSFKIKNDFEKEIDDDFTLSSSYNLNNSDRDLKVIETSISSKEIEIKALEV